MQLDVMTDVEVKRLTIMKLLVMKYEVKYVYVKIGDEQVRVM